MRKYQIVFLIVLLLASTVTLSYAYPEIDRPLLMKPYWQLRDHNILGCQDSDQVCREWRSDHPMSLYGCAVTSMAMLYWAYGIQWIPDNNHQPTYNWTDHLNQDSFNNYLAESMCDCTGFTRGFTLGYDIDWTKTTNNVYYYSDFGFFGNSPYVNPYIHYQSVRPNYDCSPLFSDIIVGDYGTDAVTTKSISCALHVKWTDPRAKTWMDNDLNNGYPVITKIKYINKSDGKVHDSHFVVIAGYDTSHGFGSDGWYRAYNPTFEDAYELWDGSNISSTMVRGAPKALNGPTQYGKKKLDGSAMFDFQGIVELNRFTGWYSGAPNKKSGMKYTVHSPVEIQVVDPNGHIIGYHPETGAKLSEDPMAQYFEDTPISALDGSDTPAEPVKRLEIVEPIQGNYILRIFGTGDGPYTIDMEGTKEDGTRNFVSSLTGTATSSLYDTYRISYSPTGEASLSQTNQAPVANAGSNQTGEQSYEITLDGSASSDSDGDPMTYTWSFISKPNNSGTTLSDPHAIKPTFTPDLPGTYTLQLVVNDHFTDSVPAIVTITATPVKSRISVTPNFSTPLSAGSSSISFDVANIGRIGVNSGIISVSLADPDGAVVNSGTQTFSIGVGGSMTVGVPVTIPPLKFGNYTLIFTQSDETRAGAPLSSAISNSIFATFAFDKITYRVRDTANLTLSLTDIGKFGIENASVNVAVSDIGYSETKTISLGSTLRTASLNYAIPIPTSVTAGQHSMNVTITAPSGSMLTQNSMLTVQDSVLVLNLEGSNQYVAGDALILTVENQGDVDTTYTTNTLSLKDNKGGIMYQGIVSGSIQSGEKKTLTNIQIPAQTVSGLALLDVTLKDTKTGKLSTLNTSVSINGLEVSLLARTGKEIYQSTESISAISTLMSGVTNIENGTLLIEVNRYKKPDNGEFKQLIPKFIKMNPYAIAAGPDGTVYMTESSASRIQKYDENGNFISYMGSFGSGNGQFYYPHGVAVAPDGSLYVADTGHHRIQKFDSNGNFITKWGSNGSGNGQFASPAGIAVTSAGIVYVADNNHRIQSFDSNGYFIRSWGGYGSGDGKFNYPKAIAVDLEGSVYVTDFNNNRIQKFDGDGNFITKWGVYGTGDGQLYGPSGIAYGSDNCIYVVDKNNNRIQKFDTNGNFIAKWGSPGANNGQLISAEGIALSPKGKVYVADTSNYRIQKFDSNGIFITSWGCMNYQGSGDGWLNGPYAIAIGPDNSIFVADNGNSRIQKFDVNGNFIKKWGSNGSSDGQFFGIWGIAVSPDGYVYATDGNNCRIQKFDGNGNFIKKWGSCGAGNGQFNGPSRIAVSPDGYVYVTDQTTIQKFDGNGNFIKKWGGYGTGNGQLYYPAGIAVGNDGYVYVADSGNNRIQKFDGSGNFVAKWGSYGSGNGQFNSPKGIAVAPDGSLYVADYNNNRIQKLDSNGNFVATWQSYGGGSLGDNWVQLYYPNDIVVTSGNSIYVVDSGNNRIQWMVPAAAISEILYQATTQVNQSANVTEDYMSNIGTLNSTGKLYLSATLKNNIGQDVAVSEYPFYVVGTDMALFFSTDKTNYKPGETITVTGTVQNLASVDATNLMLSITNQVTGNVVQSVYTETFNVAAGGSKSFTFNMTAGSTGGVTLTASVIQNTSTLVNIIDQYQVAVPKASLTITAPDIVNRNPFNLNVQITNTGTVDASMQYTATNNQGTVIDVQQLIIPAGEMRLFSYDQQIMQSSIYNVSLSGDVTQTVAKTVSYGEAAAITITPGPGIYPEGAVSIPVTVTNTGSVDESVTVTYSLSPSAASQSKTYFLPRGGSVTDTLAYDVVKGTYQLTASSLLPSASASASFTVAKDPDMTMTATAGNQNTNGLIPVTVNVANSGYSDLNGTIAVAVMNNFGKAVWRGEAPVSNLKSPTSMNYVINVDSAGILPGAYSTSVTFYNSAGQQLATNQTQVRVLGPIFEITSVPAYPSFTEGEQASLVYAVKNTGTLAGTATFSTKALDVLNQAITVSLQPGEEKPLAFTFTVPEDAVPNDYLADYALASALSQGTTGQTKFHVAGVDVAMTTSLDKQIYADGDTAVLTLTVSKKSQFDDGTYLAIIRYGSYHDMQTMTISSQPATLTFNVPLGTISGDRLFYGIYFLSGRKVSQNSLHINTSPIVTVVSPAANDIYYNSTLSIAAVVSDGGLGISTVQYQVDGGQWSSLPLTDPSGGVYSTIWTTTPSDNGTHAVTFRAADTVGNMSLPVTIGFTVQVDTMPPTGSIMINNGAAYTNDPVVTLNLGCTDAERGCAQMQFSSDNVTWSTPEAYGTPKSWTFASGDGPKTVYVKYTDAVGNPSESYSAGITLDTIPPVAIITGTPTNPTNDTGALLAVTGADVIAYKYRLDNGTYSAETLAATPITLTGLVDGSQQVFALGKDNAGNWQKDEHATVATWTVDTEMPVLTLSSLANGALTHNNTLNIAGTVTDNNGVSGVTINNAAVPLNADGTFSQVISLITGSNSITTIAKDLAGNTTTDERTIILNQSAPIINITHPFDNSVTNDSSTAVTGAVDKTASVGIKINNTSPLPEIVTDSTFNFPITYLYGQNTIEVTATDPAGNIGTAKRTVTFDNINPALAVTNPPQDMTTNQSNILLQGTVADPTITSVAITCDGITSTPTVTTGTFEQPLTFSEEKTYAIVVTATDAAGNISTVQRNIIYFKTSLYSFYGFFSPVDNPPSLNTANSGQTIPVKWRITDANGVPISDPASFKSLTSYSVNCDSFSGDLADVIEEYAAGSSGLQYLGDGNWQFNWTTSKTYAQQCRMMVLTLGDNSTHIAHFKFNK